MTIKAGDKLPSISLNIMTENGPDAVTTDDFFAGKKVAFFGVPGAFTPTCSAKHVPGFVANAAAPYKFLCYDVGAKVVNAGLKP